jgi:hypothetical protein
VAAAIQQGFWGEDQEFVRSMQGGHLSVMLSHAARRVLKVIPDELADDPSVALLRDLVPNPPEDFDPRPYIAANEWVFASTMPDHPHEYVLIRHSTDWRTHILFGRWIRRYGQVERHMGRSYRYRAVDGWRYWVLGPNDTIINRRVDE